MKIETLANLVKGELLNSPFISEVTSFTMDVDEVIRGSCFFVTNSEDIKYAIKNGAYAIVSKNYEKIVDNEIAWIKVDSIKDAILEIFKYESLKEKIYFCNEIEEELIEKMNLNKNVIILKNSNDLLKALNINNKFLITSNEKYKSLIKLEELGSKDINLEYVSLFKSKYRGIEINLPFVYKEFFARVLNFFNRYNLKYTLEFELDRFKPIFVDYQFNEVEYGSSERVLISGIKNDKFLFDELNFIIDKTKHAKTIIVNENNKDLLKKGFNFAVLVDTKIELNQKEEKVLL